MALYEASLLIARLVLGSRIKKQNAELDAEERAEREAEEQAEKALAKKKALKGKK